MAQLVEAPQQSGAHDQAAALAERRAAAHSTLDDPRSLAQLLEAGAQAGRRPRPSARKRAGSEPPAPPHAAIQRTVPSADAASEPPTTSAPQCRSPRTRRLRSDPPTAAPCPNRGCLFDQPKSAPRHASPCPLFLLGPAMPTPRTSAPRPPPARTRSSTTARRPWCPRRRHRLRLPRLADRQPRQRSRRQRPLGAGFLQACWAFYLTVLHARQASCDVTDAVVPLPRRPSAPAGEPVRLCARFAG